jgi:hypothetical protein
MNQQQGDNPPNQFMRIVSEAAKTKRKLKQKEQKGDETHRNYPSTGMHERSGPITSAPLPVDQ